MQYADIALPIKTATRQELFTYRIPPALLPEIMIGRRVSVPFYGRKLVGTIINLREHPPVIKGNFKEIKAFVDPIALFTRESLILCQSVATKYGATLGQVLNDAAPKPAPRTAKKMGEKHLMSLKNDHTTGKIFGLYSKRQERFKEYNRLIERAQKANKASLVIFTTQNFALEFNQFLNEQGIRSIVMPTTAQQSDYYRVWCEAVLGEHSIVIGTRKTVFLPIPNLKLLIIDEPSEFGYKEEQFPYYHAVTVGKIRARLANINLILGDVAPRLEEWHEKGLGKLSFLASPSQQTKISIVDTTTNRGLLPQVTLDKIQSALRQEQKVAIYFNRKGEGRFYRCLECETALYCPRCDSLLTVFSERNETLLRCSQCGYETSPPYRCEICMSYKLGPVGLGIGSLVKIVREHFPQTNIISSEESFRDNYDILVTTTQLFYMPTAVTFDLLITLYTDQLLHGSSWATNEEAFLQLNHLAERTKHLIIQTSQPEHEVIVAFSRQSIDNLYAAELALRKKHRYPPISPVTRLMITGTNKEKIQTEADLLYKELVRKFGLNKDDVYLPSPIGTGRRRGKYRYQIIIKKAITPQLLQIIPTTWLIDPEPIRLD